MNGFIDKIVYEILLFVEFYMSVKVEL
jgi:hypothetical protein